MFSLNTYQWWPLLFFNAFSEIVLCLPCSNCFNVYLLWCIQWNCLMFKLFFRWSKRNYFSLRKVPSLGWKSILMLQGQCEAMSFHCQFVTFLVPSLLDTWVLRLDLTFKFQNLLIVSINLWRFYVQPSWMTLCDSFSRPHLGDNAFCCINCVAMNCLCIWLLAFLSVIIIWLFRSYNPI